MKPCFWIVPLTILLLAAQTGCAGTFASKPGVYTAWTGALQHNDHEHHLVYVKPEQPRSPLFLVLFATGDAGWKGTSSTIFRHIADQSYYVAGFDSREVIAHVKDLTQPMKVSQAAEAVGAMIVQARHELGLPEATPVIVTGFSRGANFVLFTAGVESLQRQVGGGVAIALTREFDYLEFPRKGKRAAYVHTDDEGRIQTYPAIQRVGSIPFAVIQSTGDKYVRAEESRQLFGLDTPTRRLYDVTARDHGFHGGTEELLHNLEDALQWIEGSERAP